MDEIRAEGNQTVPFRYRHSILEREADPKPAGWPREPQFLKSHLRSEVYSTVLDCIIACFPIAFLVLAILTIRLDGKETSSYGEGIIQGTQLGPTIFPIIFASIVGSMMRTIALWRAEKGAPLGILEQLNGSTSFSGTVGTLVALRRPGLVTLSILLLWAFSPVGGQGALRMISTTPSIMSGNHTVVYLSTNSSSSFESSSSLDDVRSSINNMYGTLISGAAEAKVAPRDLWAWPKIPQLRTLPATSSSDNSTTWRTVPQNESTIYSSLVGLVVQSIPLEQAVEFSVESSYFDLDCRAVGYNLTMNQTVQAMGERVSQHNNASSLFEDESPTSARSYSNFFIDTSSSVESSPPPHIHLFYSSLDLIWNDLQHASLFNCSMSYIHVESWIECQNVSCAVTRMRQSETDQRPPAMLPFNNIDNPGYLGATPLLAFIRNFPQATGPVDRFQSSPTDGYIYGDTILYAPAYDRDWSTVSEESMSRRLTAAFNTYWQLALGPFTMNSASLSDSIYLNPSAYFQPTFNSTDGNISRPITIYRVNAGWAATFVVATVFLQLSALVCLVLRSLTSAPDILGAVSSLTRDNPHILVPPGGSALSGLERTRLLRDVRVRIADVDKDADAGHISLVGMRSGIVAYQKLDKKRLYG